MRRIAGFGARSLKEFALLSIEYSGDLRRAYLTVWTAKNVRTRDVVVFLLVDTEKNSFFYWTRLGTFKRATRLKLKARGQKIARLLRDPLTALWLASGGRP